MTTALPGALACDAHRVSSLHSVWVVPDFVSVDEEASLLAAATAPAARWTRVSGRAVQTLGGIVHERAGLLPAPLPRWVVPLLARLQRDCRLFDSAPQPLNHVLVNAYESGEGILQHQDGPLYHPAVAIVSLGAHAVMTFTPHLSLAAGLPSVRVWLPRRSLLLFAGDAYERYLHGIEATTADDPAGVCNAPLGADAPMQREGRRVSLTCRTVLKVRRGLLPGRQ